MKNLNEPLDNGLIPIVEIAKMIFNYDDETEPNYVDFKKPEFRDDMLFVSFCGDRNGCGIVEYLYFENCQFKLKIYDDYWTSNEYYTYSKIVEYNQIELLKKLIEMGVMTKDELGF